MSRKKYDDRNRQKSANKQTAKKISALWRDRWWLLAAVIFLVTGVLITGLAMRNGSRMQPERAATNERTGEQQASDAEVIPAALLKGDAAWDPSWPPLPQLGSPARHIDVVRAAYAYAVRREDVLRYIPCYCGCERQGHRSNHDCFVRGKSASGVPQWDQMGYI